MVQTLFKIIFGIHKLKISKFPKSFVYFSTVCQNVIKCFRKTQIKIFQNTYIYKDKLKNRYRIDVLI